jgi:serine/threonine-protein kinase
LTGRPPFQAESPAALARKHLEERAPPPSRTAPLPPALDEVVLRCLEKRPERRFDSARSFVTALARALERPAGGPERARGVACLGTAIYVDLRLRTAEDYLDDALGRDLGCLLDLAEERLTREGFVLAQVTGSGVLAVRPIRGGADELRREQRAALAVALSLHREITRRPTLDDRVHANITLHVGEVLVRSADGREIAGGALLRTSRWAPRKEVPGVCTTPAAIEGIEGIEAPLTIVRGPSPG